MSPIIKDSDGHEPIALDSGNTSNTPFPEDITNSTIVNQFDNSNGSPLKSRVEVTKSSKESVENSRLVAVPKMGKMAFDNTATLGRVKSSEYGKEKFYTQKTDENTKKEKYEPRLKRSQSLRIRTKTNETDSILSNEKKNSLSEKYETSSKEAGTNFSKLAEEDKPGILKSFATRFTRFSRISLTDIPEKLERPSFHNLRRSQSMRIPVTKIPHIDRNLKQQHPSDSSTLCSTNHVQKSFFPKNLSGNVYHGNFLEPQKPVKTSKSLLDVREAFRYALNNQTLSSHTPINSSVKKSSSTMFHNGRGATTVPKKLRKSAEISNEAAHNDKDCTRSNPFGYKAIEVIRKSVQSKLNEHSEKKNKKTEANASKPNITKGINDSVKRKNSKTIDLKIKNNSDLNSKRKKIDCSEPDTELTLKKNNDGYNVSNEKEITKKLRNISTIKNPLNGNKPNSLSCQTKEDLGGKKTADNTKMLNKLNKNKIVNTKILNKQNRDKTSNKNQGNNNKQKGDRLKSNLNVDNYEKVQNSENFNVIMVSDGCDTRNSVNISATSLACPNTISGERTLGSVYIVEIDTAKEKYTNKNDLYSNSTRDNSNVNNNENVQERNLNEIDVNSRHKFLELSHPFLQENSFSRFSCSSLPVILASMNFRENASKHTEESNLTKSYSETCISESSMTMSLHECDMKSMSPMSNSHHEEEKLKREFHSPMSFTDYDAYIDESIDDYWLEGKEESYFGTLFAESKLIWESLSESFQDMDVDEHFNAERPVNLQDCNLIVENMNNDVLNCLQDASVNKKRGFDNTSLIPYSFTHITNEDHLDFSISEDNNCELLEQDKTSATRNERLSEQTDEHFCQPEVFTVNKAKDASQVTEVKFCKSEINVDTCTNQIIETDSFRNHENKSSSVDLVLDILEASPITEKKEDSGTITCFASPCRGADVDLGDCPPCIRELKDNTNVASENDNLDFNQSTLNNDSVNAKVLNSVELLDNVSNSTLDAKLCSDEDVLGLETEMMDEKSLILEEKLEQISDSKLVEESGLKLLKKKARTSIERKPMFETHIKNKIRKDRKLNKVVLCTTNNTTKFKRLKENPKPNSSTNPAFESTVKSDISDNVSININKRTISPKNIKAKQIVQEAKQDDEKRRKISKSRRDVISHGNRDAKALAIAGEGEGEGSASAGLGTPGSRVNAKDRANRAPPTRASSRLGTVSLTNDEKLRQEVSAAASSRRPKIDNSKSPLTKTAWGTPARANTTDPVKVLRPTAPITQPRSPVIVTSPDQLKKLESELFARTQEVQKAKEEAAKASRGFEALSVIINHLTNEYDAFSTPRLKAEIDRISAQLTNVQLSLDESNAAAKRLEDEATDKCQKQVDEIRNLERLHTDEIDSITLEHQRKTEQVVEKHQLELREAVAKEECKHQELVNSHKEELERIDYEWREQLGKQHERHLVALEQLNTCHTKQLREAEESWEAKEKELQENNARLLKEQNVLKQQAKKLEETLLSDKDHRLQAAKRVCTALQNEVDSLKTVVEMRNNEVHKLRDQLTDKEQLSEDLEAARERVRALQAKTEDLLAQMEKKSQLERQLLADHHTLADTLQRESCSNKRLSLENEELQWKLRQREASAAGTHSTSTLDLVTRCTSVIARQQDGCKSGSLSHQGTLRSQRIGIRSQPYKSEQEKHWSRSFGNIPEDAGKFLRRSELQNEDVTIESPPPSPRVKSVIEKSNSVSFILDLNDTLPSEPFLGLSSSPLIKKPRTPTLSRKILHKSYSNILEKSSSTPIIPGRTKETSIRNSQTIGNECQSKFDTKIYSKNSLDSKVNGDYGSDKNAEDRNKMSNGKIPSHSTPNYNNRGYSTSESSDGGEIERISPTGLSWTVPVHPKVMKRYSNSKSIPNRYHLVPEAPRLLQQPDEDEYEEIENEFVEVLTLGDDVNSSPLTNLFNQTPSTSVSLSDSDISQCGSRADLSTEDECTDEDEGTQRISMQNDSSLWRPQEGAGEAMIFPDVFEFKGDKKIVGLKENCKEISTSQISSAPSSDSEEAAPQPLNGESGLNMSWSEEIDCDLTSSSEMQEL